MPSTITTPNAIIGFLPDGQAVYEIRGGAPEPDEDTPAPEGEETPAPEGESTPDGDPEADGLDEKTRATISKLRGEAAGWRTQLREAQEALKAAKTPEDFQAAVNDFEAKIAAKDEEIFARDRALVIATHKLPADLAALLPEKGKTIEELTTLAKGLAKYAPADEDDLEGEGGLNPGSSGKSATDPASLAKQVRGQRARFIR